MATEKFNELMLQATFDFARLALGNAVLLNGAGATALLAFMSTHQNLSAGCRCGVLLFAVGAACGGIATVLAYLGQRQNWEAVDKKSPAKHVLANRLILSAVGVAGFSYLLFFLGVLEASSGL